MVALFAARNAGIEIPDDAISKGKKFLLECQDEKGGFGYTGNSGANLPRTAIGSLILALDKDTKSDAFQKSIDYLRENARFGDQGHKFYSLYYTAQAMFRSTAEDWNKWNLENVQKQGYEHFMLKEINEQPDAIKNALRGRLISNIGIKISSIDENEKKFLNAKRIIIVACGTSWHAGLVGEYLIESIAKIPVEVEYASEFRYRDPLVFQDDIVIPISQSGETADTLAAINIAKNKNPFIYGICNVVGSSISRQTDSGIYTHAGPEIGVASTKAFTTQITVLILLAIKISEIKGNISKSELISLLVELKSVPDKIKKFLNKESRIITIAKKIYNSPNALYLGRGLNFPVALEGALKLKEISYIHAEGYPAAEMKHGPIALIDKEMPVIVIATKKGHYEKIVSNIQEIKSRNGKIISIVTQGDEIVKELSDYYIEIPESTEYFSPLFTTIPLQLLAYHIAVLRKCNVDMPRNLAKSVTVE